MLFDRRTKSAYADSLAAYMPGGELFKQKSVKDSNFRKLLEGLAGELFRANGYLKSYNEEHFPDQTTLFISEWESTLGIPDDCFSGTGTDDERRRDILVKLASLGVQTADDFVELGALFGVSLTVGSGATNGAFPMTLPITLYPSGTAARHTILVTFTLEGGDRFPLTLPFTLGSSEIGILECLFSKLKPANCDILFKQV